MPIEVRCECGRRLHAPEEAAGRRVRCPACGAAVGVPEVVAEEPAVSEPRKTRSKRRAPAPDTRASSRPLPPPPLPPPLSPTIRPGQNVFQPHVDGIAPLEESARRRKKRRSRSDSGPSSSWLTSLCFPFRTEAFLAICIMTILYTCIMVPLQHTAVSPLMLSPRVIAGVIFLMLLIQGYFWHFLFQVLRTAAYNEPDLPMTSDWDPENIIYDLLIAVGSTMVALIPLLAYGVYQLWSFIVDHFFLAGIIAGLGLLNLPFLLLMIVSHLPDIIRAMLDVSPSLPWLMIVLVIAACAYLPMAMLASVLHQTVRGALPWHVLPAIVRVRWGYLETLILVTGVAGLGAFFQALTAYVPFFGAFLSWFIVFIGHTAVMHRLGAMYYENRHALGWFPDSPRII